MMTSQKEDSMYLEYSQGSKPRLPTEKTAVGLVVFESKTHQQTNCHDEQ